MTPVRAFKIASVNTTNVAGLILALRWMTPSAADWNRIDEMYRRAEARHEFLCVYTPLADTIRGTAFDGWLHGSQALHVAVALLIAALLVYFSATWFQRGMSDE
jgi:hypothetical protein